MKSKRAEMIETLRARLELAEIQRDLHSVADCKPCRDSVYSVTAPVCFVALEQTTRCRDIFQRLTELERRSSHV